MFSDRDHVWMLRAFELANRAAVENEVPVGAVVVLNDKIVGEGYNAPIQSHDPSAHAEMMAMRAAARCIGNYRLVDTSLYVTLEPCLMCAGAMVHARIGRLVYGAADLKAGAVESQCRALDFSHLNHKISCQGGLLAGPCGELLTRFFKSRRKA